MLQKVIVACSVVLGLSAAAFAQEVIEAAPSVSGSVVSSGSSLGASLSTSGPVGSEGALRTWYDPYYYGYYGVFYNHYGSERGYYIARRWRNAYMPSSYSPYAYPEFYQAHFAAHPEQYFYPYNYYPVYYYQLPLSYSYFQYPQAPVIITQPYAPLIKNDAPKRSPETTPESSLVEQIVAAAIAPPTRFVSTDGEPAEITVVNDDQETARTLYASAYHAYWREDYEAAQQMLQKAVEADNQDARLWYYLGLSELALGEEAQAAERFAQAVKLHIQHPEQSSLVNKALERVQGEVRLQLHQAKRQAEYKLAESN